MLTWLMLSSLRRGVMGTSLPLRARSVEIRMACRHLLLPTVVVVVLVNPRTETPRHDPLLLLLLAVLVNLRTATPEHDLRLPLVVPVVPPCPRT